MDLTNFSTYHDHEEAIENEGFQDEEVEMTEKNTIKLLVTADEASQFWANIQLLNISIQRLNVYSVAT